MYQVPNDPQQKDAFQTWWQRFPWLLYILLVVTACVVLVIDFRIGLVMGALGLFLLVMTLIFAWVRSRQ